MHVLKYTHALPTYVYWRGGERDSYVTQYIHEHSRKG